MKHDETLDLCRKSGFSAFKKGDALSVAVMHGIESQICTLEVLNLVKLVEQATLERAAKVCSDMADKALKDGIYIESTGKDAAHSYGQAQAAKLAELAIRALKDSND